MILTHRAPYGRKQLEQVLMPFRAFDDSDNVTFYGNQAGSGAVLMPFRAFDDSDPNPNFTQARLKAWVLMPFRAFDDSDGN